MEKELIDKLYEIYASKDADQMDIYYDVSSCYSGVLLKKSKLEATLSLKQRKTLKEYEMQLDEYEKMLVYDVMRFIIENIKK